MTVDLIKYRQFLSEKVVTAEDGGISCSPEDVNPILKPHQRDIVMWAVKGGKRAIFTAFGLGKTMIQLEVCRIIISKTAHKKALIVIPLGVRQEFIRDAGMLGINVRFVRTNAEATDDGIYLTNYESVREGKIDPTKFFIVSLDEAGILRGFGGSKTFREFMKHFEGREGFRFVATATPSPNEYIELLAYSCFLDVMDVGQAKTRFFKRNSEKADQLTLHEHKEREFWLWVSTWAVFLQKPSDLGYSDEGYSLPPIDVRWHEIETDHSHAMPDRWGQRKLIKDSAIGVQEAAREKRDSLELRIEKMLELRNDDIEAHRIIWHDLESERHAIEAAVPSVASVYGSQDLYDREESIIAFSEGRLSELAAKPVMLGSGCNFQKHCHWAIYLGIGFKFADFIQSIHRLQRFLQTETVRIDLIYTEAERRVREQLERKWDQHNQMVANMTDIIKEYGLSSAAIHGSLTRLLGCERDEANGENWKVILNDSVEECETLESDSVHLILTSIPFGTQYEYSPSYNDFGHTDNNEHFWEQMDYLTPNLLRALKPGRICAIHVKDRIVPGGMLGLGFQTVAPFHSEAILHYMKHGFAYLGMKTIVTDVVRENAQTYRLGWTEQCKDGSRMGCGMPEYLLLFRKPPTDRSNGYADEPVVKSKERYTRARWQFDAHGFMKSSGNRLIGVEDLNGLTHAEVFQVFKKHSLSDVYDFEHDVELAEYVDSRGMLPPSFMLLQPQSWHEDVWTDVTRMRTLNLNQSNKGKEMHLCPMQFDIADRCIEQFTMEGETVLDPFSGLGTVPMRAVSKGRFGLGIELSPAYWKDSIGYLKMAASERSIPSLFDFDEMEEVSA